MNTSLPAIPSDKSSTARNPGLTDNGATHISTAAAAFRLQFGSAVVSSRSQSRNVQAGAREPAPQDLESSLKRCKRQTTRTSQTARFGAPNAPVASTSSLRWWKPNADRKSKTNKLIILRTTGCFKAHTFSATSGKNRRSTHWKRKLDRPNPPLLNLRVAMAESAWRYSRHSSSECQRGPERRKTFKPSIGRQRSARVQVRRIDRSRVDSSARQRNVVQRPLLHQRLVCSPPGRPNFGVAFALLPPPGLRIRVSGRDSRSPCPAIS